MIEGLPPNDPAAALEELAGWADTLGAARDVPPAARVEALYRLGEAARPRVRRLGREYFGAPRPNRIVEHRQWNALHGWARASALALGGALDAIPATTRTPAAPLAVRTLRAVAQWLKWMHLRYGPVDRAVWALAYRAYRTAHMQGLATTPAEDSTPEGEFVKLVFFSASALDGLLPRQIEVAERIVAEQAERFAMRLQYAPGQTAWLDLAQPGPPQRLRAPVARATETQRFFAACDALEAIEALADRLREGGPVPPTFADIAGCDEQMLLEVIEHLRVHWSPQPPQRRSRRHAVKWRLAVAHGYDGVLNALSPAHALDGEVNATETWVVDNASTGGFGATVERVRGDWLRVGTLVAVRPEGSQAWAVGVVRRLARTEGNEAHVGIETVGRHAELARFALRAEDEPHELGVLLRDSGAPGQVRLMVRPGVYAPAQNLHRRSPDGLRIYSPEGSYARGEDYEIGRYREVLRPA